MVAPVYTLIWPQMDQKKLGPLEKPLRRTEMCISLMCVSVIEQSKYKKRRLRRRRIILTSRIRREKERRKEENNKRKDPKTIEKRKKPKY